MKTRSWLPAVLLLVSGIASAQGQKPVTEADFAVESARVSSPARRGADQALQQLAAQWRSEAGNLPQGFPFDVPDVADLQRARVGYGFQVFDVDAGSIAAGQPLAKSARATGMWRYAVTVDGTPVGLMTLVETAQGWEAVSFGGAGLVKEVDALVQVQASRGSAQLRYLRVPQATADFIEVRSGSDAARFAPLRAARESLRLSALRGVDGLLAEAQVQDQLRAAVAQDSSN